jgi:outer membrane biosynthesis protein TonB
MNSVGIRRNTSRWETAAAFLASLLLHLFFLLAVAFVILKSPAIPKEKSPTLEEPPQLTILPMPAAPKTAPRFVSTTPQENLEKKPNKDAAFESDNDSIAASEALPSGQEMMPSLEGREDQSLDLRDQRYTVGQKPAQAMPVAQAAEQSSPEAEASPTPRMETDLALLEAPKPTPKPTPAQKAKTATRPSQNSESGFQPETRVTRLRGNVSNRGKASLEANATPLGRYKKQVSDAIGSRWYYYVNSQMGLLNIGTVDIRFTVTPEGKIKSPQVLSNSSNESFASVSLASVVQAEVPPMPPEVAKLIENGRLELDFSFTIIGH